VSRFEANLLRILRFFLKRGSADQALPLIFARCEAPPCLSRTAVLLVQDTLAKGCTHLLARAGAWRRERYLRAGQGVDGRLWERTPPQLLGLSFSRHTMKFLMWITAEDPTDKKTRWTAPDEDERSVGDLLLCFYAFEALRDTDAARSLWQRSLFTHHGLCHLAYPEQAFGATKQPLSFAAWTSEPGAFVLEALQPDLTRRCLQVEDRKGQLVDWSAMQTLGHAQERALTAFLDAVEKAQRPDLARFLLVALGQLLAEHSTPAAWIGKLHGAGPRLADRTETYRAAFVLLRQLDRLRQWQRQAQSVGYFDEGYGTAQFWQGEWDRWQGETLHARAQAILRQVEPFVTQGNQS
jgi:hypothetical protein